jgi:hypothetical protein
MFLCWSPSMRITRSPSWMFSWVCCHFRRDCKVCKYSRRQRDQNCSARTWTNFHCEVYTSRVLRLLKSSTQSLVLVVNKAFGDKTHGESQSDEIGTNGREFIMAVVSTMNVHRTSCVSLLYLASYKIESIIRRAMPISLSHEPLICEEYGVLNFHTVPWSLIKVFKVLSSTQIAGIPSSFAPPMKFVPLSEKNSFTLSQIAIKRRNALIKDEVLISSMTYMWTALQERQENKTAHRLELTLSPRVRLVTISQEPKQSTPT